MEVISKSAFRPKRKGVSLTSKNKFNSQSKELYSTKTFSGQASFRQNNYLTNFKSVQIQSSKQSSCDFPQNFNLLRPLARMPKINFRYTNECCNSKNQFSIKRTTFGDNSRIQGRFICNNELRNVVTTKSIQTLFRTKKKPTLQPFNLQSNSIKKLIDSRKIDRQIIYQKSYQLFFESVKQHQLLKDRSLTTIQQELSPQIKFTSSNHKQKPKIVENTSSPYDLLVSKRTKNECINSSATFICEESFLPLASLQKICEVRQFNFTLNEQDCEQNSITGTSSQTFAQLRVSEKQHPRLDCKQNSITGTSSQTFAQLRVSEKQHPRLDCKQNSITGTSSQTFTQLRVSEKQHPELIVCNFHQQTDKKVLKNLRTELNLVPLNTLKSQFMEKKNKSQSNQNQSIVVKVKQNFLSPEIKKQRIVHTQLFVDIQNRPPSNHSNLEIRGKRNVKRIRQIEKRLEQIISICSQNI